MMHLPAGRINPSSGRPAPLWRRWISVCCAIVLLAAGLLTPLAGQALAMPMAMAMAVPAMQHQDISQSAADHDCHSEAAKAAPAEHIGEQGSSPCPTDCQFCVFCAIASGLPAPALPMLPSAAIASPAMPPNAALPVGRSLLPRPKPPRI